MLVELNEVDFFVHNNSKTSGHNVKITKKLFKSNVCNNNFWNCSVYGMDYQMIRFQVTVL